MKLHQLGIMALAVTALFACEPKNNEPQTPTPQEQTMKMNPESVMMNFGDSIQLSVVGATGPFDWTSDNNYNAMVDSTGKVYGYCIGSTTIRAKKGSKEATCTITINPKSTLYDEPCLDWGADTTAVKAKATGERSSLKNDSILMYTTGTSKDIVIQYLFRDNKLTLVGALMATSYSSEISQYIFERYAYYGTQNDILYFFNAMEYKNASLQVSLSVVKMNETTNAIQVIYMKVDPKTTAPMRKVSMPYIAM